MHDPPGTRVMSALSPTTVLGGVELIIPVTLAAAAINGAIGYGFSTLTVPVALLYYTSRVLNPALVLIEIVLNLAAVILNRKGIPSVWRRVLPLMLASLPGIALGGVALKAASTDGLRLATFLVLLPLVLLQTAGVRRPLPASLKVDVPVGFGIGVLYACTTISGPPLGLLFNNQGLEKDSFRAALSLFRLTESVATGLVYWSLSVYTPEAVQLSLYILPCVLIGLPLGRLTMSRIEPETFRRVCMAFDAWLISFGLYRLFALRGGLLGQLAYVPMALVLVLNAALLYRYFRRRRLRPSA